MANTASSMIRPRRVQLAQSERHEYDRNFGHEQNPARDAASQSILKYFQSSADSGSGRMPKGLSLN